MEEETLQADVVPNSDDQPAEAQKSDTKPSEPMIPKSRLDEVIAAKKELEKLLERENSAKQAAEKAALEEQGEFKRLYEDAQASAQAAQNELDTLKLNGLKRDVATSMGYPSLWDRISGATEDELKEDMANLIASIPAPTAPNINGQTGSGAPRADGKGNGLYPALREKWAGELGVPLEYMPQEI